MPGTSSDSSSPRPGAVSTGTVAAWLSARLVGPADLPIRGMQTLAEAGPDELTLIGSGRHAAAWERSAARAALVTEGLELAPTPDRALLYVADVDLATALVLERLPHDHPAPPPGVHPTAVVDHGAEVDASARIGPLCWIGAGAVIGADTVLHGQVTVMARARIGAGCELWPGVVIREACEIGDRCTLHSNVSIGTDGFGYRPSADRSHLVKMPHRGTVRIGSDVEIGANACVDRAKFGATEIGDGTKLDNLVQIAHNCVVGRSVVMAGHTALGGSSRVGDGAVLGGRVAVRDHVSVGRGAQIGACSLVAKDVDPGARVAGYPAIDLQRWLRLQTLLSRLPETLRRLSGRGD